MSQQVRITISTRAWALISAAAARAKMSRGKFIEQQMTRVLDPEVSWPEGIREHELKVRSLPPRG